LLANGILKPGKSRLGKLLFWHSDIDEVVCDAGYTARMEDTTNAWLELYFDGRDKDGKPGLVRQRLPLVRESGQWWFSLNGERRVSLVSRGRGQGFRAPAPCRARANGGHVQEQEPALEVTLNEPNESTANPKERGVTRPARVWSVTHLLTPLVAAKTFAARFAAALVKSSPWQAAAARFARAVTLARNAAAKLFAPWTRRAHAMQ
jgi:hypothetical protein